LRADLNLKPEQNHKPDDFRDIGIEKTNTKIWVEFRNSILNRLELDKNKNKKTK